MKLKLGFGAAVVAIVAVWLAVGPAQLGGGATYVTTHGASMEPRFRAGDLVALRPASSYGVGDVVAYHSARLDTVVMHRIVAAEGGRYTLKGDKNSWLDPDRPSHSQLVGTSALRIPQGGIWLDRSTSPPVLGAAAFLLLAGGSAAEHTRRRRRKDRRTVAQDPAPARRPLGDLPPNLRPVAAGVAAVAVIGSALGILAWSHPATDIVSADEASTPTMDFSYSATVPPSPAYDGPTVTDPQPVFLNLTDTVDVTFQYEGQPGTVTVDADLSTSSGWRSTVRLADPVRFDGETYEGTVQLDLSALRDRAEAAAAVTGMPAQTVNLAVVPRVSLDQGGGIAPRLELTLDALALRLSGADTATVEDATSVSGSRTRPTKLSVLGRSVTVATARTAASATVALATLTAVALLVVARRVGPATEAQRIRQKYGQLLLPVLPMALAPGRAVVDVPDVGSLARLAERYGLLVLHWSRSGVDTYVVQDDKTTFRYRTAITEQAPADDRVAGTVA